MAIFQEATSAPARLGGRAGFGWQYRFGRLVLLPLGFALAGLVAWESFCRASRISLVLLPPPSAVWSVLSDNWEILFQQSVPTILESIISFAAATLLGVALAVAITFSAWVREALYPNIVMFQLIPKIALAPLFVVWLGIASESRVAFATFVSFFPVVISAAVGFASCDRSALLLCRSLTASQWQSFAAVRFPFALPAIFSGMKIAMTMAIIGVIIGEFISAKAGLGFYILYASSRMETAVIFAALFVLCAIGVAPFGAVALCEELVRRAYGRR
jgi:NitT/TauT family transport system permease protein